MIQVKFYNTVEDELLKFAVIVSKYKDKWVFCKHRDRDTYEIPGGHREDKEAIIDTAKRELYEESGALVYDLHKVCVYSVVRDDLKDPSAQETFGMLFYAEIREFGQLPDMEIERIELFDEMPENLTYPYIQPYLMEKVITYIKERDSNG